MAGQHEHRNNSSQMRDLLQPDQDFDGLQKEKHHDHTSRGGSSQACCSSSPSGPSGPCDGGSRPGGQGELREERERREQREQVELKELREQEERREQEELKELREQGSSSCCQLSDLKRFSHSDRKSPLTFSRTHTVLVDVSVFNNRGRLVPQEGKDMWNSEYVKMPFSQSNHMFTKNFLQVIRVSRWEVISKQLKALASKKKVSVTDVEEAIIKYNPKYKDQWRFDGLLSFVKCIPKEENYFSTLFPKMAALALRLPELVRKGVPLLKQGETAAVTLSQVQISCLLANAFFCTFPHRNMSGPKAEYHNYPSINFSSLFGNWSERKKEKLRAIMHYFNAVTDENAKPTGLVTFERRYLRDVDFPRLEKETLTKLHVTSHGSIETQGAGMLQVDFASSLVGGGVLGSGLVQEEILFLINPELIVSRLFTEQLMDSECLIITGTQQFSIYSGFGDTFEWAGPHEDDLQRDDWTRLKRQILAINALNFKHVRDQYNMSNVTRELNKAFCGFMGPEGNEPDIATGKWGCGAFHGDPQLKALIQLMAAAKARRGLAFFTFGDERLKRGLEQIYHLLVTEGTTVERLHRLLENFCAIQRLSATTQVDLFEFIRTEVRHSRSQL